MRSCMNPSLREDAFPLRNLRVTLFDIVELQLHLKAGTRAAFAHSATIPAVVLLEELFIILRVERKHVSLCHTMLPCKRDILVPRFL